MDRSFYEEEANRIVGDTATYSILKDNPTVRFSKELKMLLLLKVKEQGILNEGEFNYLWREMAKLRLLCATGIKITLRKRSPCSEELTV